MFERTWTVSQQAGGAAVYVLDPIGLPGGEPDLELEAWQTGTGAVVVFRDALQLSEAQERISASGLVDCVCVVPPGGRACLRVDSDIHALTVFFLTGGGNQLATVRIRER